MPQSLHACTQQCLQTAGQQSTHGRLWDCTTLSKLDHPERCISDRTLAPVIVCIVVCRCKLCMQTLQEYETAMQGSEQATLAFHKYMFMYIHVFLGALPYR
jgi:hypothetical protein